MLLPTLPPGQLVVLDHVRSPKGATLWALLEAQGCRLLFLPAYSPACSPIEYAFLKVKTLRPRAAARIREALEAALVAALAASSSQDARGWFTACGYRVEAQSL